MPASYHQDLRPDQVNKIGGFVDVGVRPVPPAKDDARFMKKGGPGSGPSGEGATTQADHDAAAKDHGTEKEAAKNQMWGALNRGDKDAGLKHESDMNAHHTAQAAHELASHVVQVHGADSDEAREASAEANVASAEANKH